MNSLPLPLANFILRKQTAFNSLNLTRFSNNYLATAESSSVINLSKQDNGESKSVEASTTINSMVYGRRDAIGIGLGFGLFDFSVLPRKVAAADDAATCDFTSTPSGLAYCDTVLGDGASPVKGQLIKAHYVGKLENGKVFDSSYSRGKPLSFRVGVGEVIKGWDQGILGGEGVPPMLSGGKRILRIPPELGYGVRGAGCKGGTCIIPPNSVLLFDVEFIGKA